MKLKYLLATSALVVPFAAHAQSTGSAEFEDTEIIVTGSVTSGVEGVIMPDTSKAKQVLTQEQIGRNNPGQTILDSINTIPGVTFTNNDAYGSSGGQLSIRGFGQDRISLTFDGVPLNDSGNYQIYANQQLDPELIEQVNVNLGTTDVDSPTAAATGSTVNYRTRIPNDEFTARLAASLGEDNFWRLFGSVDSGALTSLGTRVFLAASHSQYDNPYNNYGKVNKEQYNARIYQPIGSGDDFVSLSGHYNVNRNNFFGSLPLRLDRTVPNGFPQDQDERKYDINFPCTVSTTATPGDDDLTNGCGTEFDRRYNPSNTGNLRGSSRFTLTEGLTLSVDPSYQYVKANGGGTVNARERLVDINPTGTTNVAGYVGGRPYFGMDLNGDGDLLDEITMVAPSQTQTHRLGLITNLIWEFDPNHTARLAYTFDRARHRQTGEVGLLDLDGEPFDVFPVNDPQSDVTGTVLQKRDRLSFAVLHQVSAEYRGAFLDEALTVTAGLRAPFFTRDLNNFCFTTSDSGFVDCFGRGDPRNATYAAANPTVQGPQQRVLKYDKLLPNVGFVYDITAPLSVFANYSKGLQVPGTDALYNAFFFAPNTASARPNPETTNNFDLGLRYRSGAIQAQAVGWYTQYKNRLASAYDPITERNVYRNLGDVDKYGIDASIAWQPVEPLVFYLFGSYMKSEIKDDVQSGACTQAQVDADTAGCTAVDQPLFVATAGNREGGAPAYTYGAQARGTLGPVELGITAKKTGGRYIFDSNLPIFGGTAAAPTVIYPAKTNAYWMVNLDARVQLDEYLGLNRNTFLQLNVYNLFDKLYVGNYTSGLNQGNVLGQSVFLGSPGSPPFAQIGAPRTVSATLSIEY
ncbi:MAG TPA: TonB-dependent receptor [Croceibacterium sp.]|nr:TonB-dependent receptor [Croceibacterium sp.]